MNTSTIQHHAAWLAYHADLLRAAIGAGDPTGIEGLHQRLADAERDIAEIRRRMAKYEDAA